MTQATPIQTTAGSLIPVEIPVRFAARVIDAALLTAAGIALGRQIGFGFNWLIPAAGMVLAYFALADALLGATLGKAAMRLRVVDMHGNKPSVKQAMIRECFMLFGAVPFAGPLLALAAWVWIVFTIGSSPLRQGVHDRWAGTRVVRR